MTLLVVGMLVLAALLLLARELVMATESEQLLMLYYRPEVFLFVRNRSGGYDRLAAWRLPLTLVHLAAARLLRRRSHAVAPVAAPVSPRFARLA